MKEVLETTQDIRDLDMKIEHVPNQKICEVLKVFGKFDKQHPIFCGH